MLDLFFDPRGVAVIGASSNPHKLGHGVVRNLTEHRYRGSIYPVNPKATEILGHRCYPAIDKVPDPVDLAVIIVPAAAVSQVIDECGKRGIGHAIIVSGGFGEIGEAGRAREEALLRVARKHDMRLIGPNCIGTIDTHTPINTTFVVGMPQAGGIGFVSQSGAMCAVVIDWARGAGVGFSRIISLGNQIDVTESEMLEAMASDSHTRVITAYIEGVANGPAFMSAAKEAASKKPVVVLKGGYGESGAKAVASHTGALAGSAKAFDAVLRHCGVLRAETMEELFDWARALAWQPLPEGNRVGVLTNAGGPAILAVDAMEAAGLSLAPLTQHTKDYLRQRLPPVCSVENPIDILAGSGPGLYAIALDALLSDPTVDAGLVIQAPQDWFLPASLAEVISEVAAVHNKPILASIMGLASVDQALAILHRRRVPNFAFPERAASALAAMISRREWLKLPAESPVEFTDIDFESAREALRQGNFAGALAAYGIRIPPAHAAKTVADAIQYAEEIGYPVVLKLLSSEITHKSDVGGVMLELADSQAVGRAFKRITDDAKAKRPQAAVDGVLVQKMLSGGLEIIVGARRDQQFGQLVLVGGGGVDVELRPDVAMGIVPLSRGQAERMLEATYASKRLAGWRGAPPADKDAVIDALLRLAQLVSDFPEISELEINPLYTLAMGEGAYALDVRGVMANPAD